MRQTLVAALRRVRLVDHADRIRYHINALQTHRENRDFRRAHPDFAPPPPKLLYEISSSTSLVEYDRSGLRAARFFWSKLEAHLPRGNVAVCEWGCGVGRILRHMREVSGGRTDRLVGLDYNPVMIEWCRRALPAAEFHINHLMPPVNLPDASFDALYCWSVFTHLSEEGYWAWVPELLRLVRPGGFLAFTTASNRAYLLPHELKVFDAGGLVVRTSTREGSRTFVAYASPQFIHAVAGEALHFPGTSTGMGQDLWLVRKDSAWSPRKRPALAA